MDITRKDAANLFNDDGTLDARVLSWYAARLPHLYELARQASLYVGERMCLDEFEGGWQTRGRTMNAPSPSRNAIDSAKWLWEEACRRGSDYSRVHDTRAA